MTHEQTNTRTRESHNIHHEITDVVAKDITA